MSLIEGPVKGFKAFRTPIPSDDEITNISHVKYINGLHVNSTYRDQLMKNLNSLTKVLTNTKAKTKTIPLLGHNDYPFEIGNTYELDRNDPLVMCKSGFHFCQIADDCNRHYPLDKFSRYAEVEAYDVIHDTNKSVARKIHIVKEISRKEWYELCGRKIWWE